MMGFSATTTFDAGKVEKAVRNASFRNLGHAGGAIRLTARRSIKKRRKASPPGQPPHTRRGQLRGAIVYAVEKDRQSVVVGPQHRDVGDVGLAHEFGGRFRGQTYPKRAFMGPALEKVKDRLPRKWANSVR